MTINPAKIDLKQIKSQDNQTQESKSASVNSSANLFDESPETVSANQLFGEAQGSYDTAANLFDQTGNEISGLNTAYSSQLNSTTEAENQHALDSASVQNLSSSLSFLENAIQAGQKNIFSFQAGISNSDQAVVELNAKISEKQGQISAEYTKIHAEENLRSQKNQIKSSYDFAVNAAPQVKEAIANLTSTIDQLTQSITGIEDQLKGTSVTRQKLNADGKPILDASGNPVMETVTVEPEPSVKQALTEQLNQLKQQLADAQSELASKNSELSNLENAISEYTSSYASVCEQHAQALEIRKQAEANIDTLSTSLANLYQQRGKELVRINDYYKQIGSTTDKISKDEVSKSQLQTQLSLAETNEAKDFIQLQKENQKLKDADKMLEAPNQQLALNKKNIDDAAKNVQNALNFFGSISKVPKKEEKDDSKTV